MKCQLFGTNGILDLAVVTYSIPNSNPDHGEVERTATGSNAKINS